MEGKIELIKNVHYGDSLDNVGKNVEDKVPAFCDVHEYNLLLYAKINDNVNLIKWLSKEIDEDTYNELIFISSLNGDIDTLNWWKKIHERDGIELKYDMRPILWASKESNIEVLEWWRMSGLRLKYCEWTIDWVSSHNKVDVLNWWKNSGLEMLYTVYALDYAIKNNCYEAIKWWKESGLKIKHENGLLWAKKNKNEKVIKWLKKLNKKG